MNAASTVVWRRFTLLTLVIMVPTCTAAQTLTVSVVSGAMRVQGRGGLGVVDGPVLDRLKQGRSVRVDFELTVLGNPAGPIVQQRQQGYTLSFDLWEERFAVTRVGTPPLSVSHLRASGAENWCLENLAIPLGSLGRYGRQEPFWLRLVYRVRDLAVSSGEQAGDRFTLQGLIDRLSRRRNETDLEKAIDAGPFRLSN